jgi:hypothetical protein
MRIAGEWRRFDDGVHRPVIRVRVQAIDGTLVEDLFLVDIGADRTVVIPTLAEQLRLPATLPVQHRLSGISGTTAFALLRTALQLTRDDGNPVTLRGEFAVFTDAEASDINILGRDVLDSFDVIVSRPRNEVLLLSQRHTYQVVQV